MVWRIKIKKIPLILIFMIQVLYGIQEYVGPYYDIPEPVAGYEALHARIREELSDEYSFREMKNDIVYHLLINRDGVVDSLIILQSSTRSDIDSSIAWLIKNTRFTFPETYIEGQEPIWVYIPIPKYYLVERRLKKITDWLRFWKRD